MAGRLQGRCPSFPHRHGRVQWRWWRSPIGRETAACTSEQHLLATPPNQVLKDIYKLSKPIMNIQVLSSNKIPHRSVSLRGSVLRATVAKWPNRNGQPYIGFSGLGFQGVSPTSLSWLPAKWPNQRNGRALVNFPLSATRSALERCETAAMLPPVHQRMIPQIFSYLHFPHMPKSCLIG